jgi:hypothetical protein
MVVRVQFAICVVALHAPVHSSCAPVTMLISSNVLMGFLCAFGFLWQALFVHEKTVFHQVDQSEAGDTTVSNGI